MTMIKLYDAANIDQLVWPEDKRYERDYILPFMRSPAGNLIRNISTAMHVLQVGRQIFPLTVNDHQYGNSYVCSPYTHYISYFKDEVRMLSSVLEGKLVCLSTVPVGWFYRFSKINKVVCVNNWLLSTNLYPDWQGSEIQEITDYLVEKYPRHVIMFRSLNKHTTKDLLSTTCRHGYRLVISRPVYFFDKKHENYMGHRNTKKDLKFLSETSYKVVGHDDIQEADYERIEELYSMLYVNKYSRNNPQFTKELIGIWHKSRLLFMNGLRNKNGQLDGIIGHFIRNDVATAPLVGYDTTLPASTGLYRLLTALQIRKIGGGNLAINLSAGVGDYKRMRGGLPDMEFSAVYYQHLPWGRQLVWRFLKGPVTRMGCAAMMKYKL